MTPQERKALDGFVAAVRSYYGERLDDILVFGSRARGDNKPDSDLDLAVILHDGDWKASREVVVMADMTYDTLMASGLFIQPVPISLTAWKTPQNQPNRDFLEAIQREARPLQVAA